MPKQSSILKLPEEVRSYISKIREQGYSLDEIKEALEQEFDIKVSRSTLHRYDKHVDRIGKRIRESRIMAESVARQFGDKPTSDVALANIEMLHTLIMDILVFAPEDGNKKLDGGDAMKIAIALEKLTKAHAIDTDRELKIRAEAAKEAKLKAAEAVDNVAKSQGLTRDTVQKIKQKILGVS